MSEDTKAKAERWLRDNFKSPEPYLVASLQALLDGLNSSRLEAEARIRELEEIGREYVSKTDPLISCSAWLHGGEQDPKCGDCLHCQSERVRELEAEVALLRRAGDSALHLADTVRDAAAEYRSVLAALSGSSAPSPTKEPVTRHEHPPEQPCPLCGTWPPGAPTKGEAEKEPPAELVREIASHTDHLRFGIENPRPADAKAWARQCVRLRYGANWALGWIRAGYPEPMSWLDHVPAQGAAETAKEGDATEHEDGRGERRASPPVTPPPSVVGVGAVRAPEPQEPRHSPYCESILHPTGADRRACDCAAQGAAEL